MVVEGVGFPRTRQLIELDPHRYYSIELGDAPATRLSEAMERKLGILVLMVDPDRDISGAACRLPELDAVLIARREVAGRRHFDLAHELFHILTWDAMPPGLPSGTVE